jgi:SAM-dependent methyltransferase
MLRRVGLQKGDWKEGLPEELQFWQRALESKGKQWLEWEYKERTDPNLELNDELKALVPDPPPVVRILDVGAGPLTRLGKRWTGRQLEIVAVDPLAAEYNALMERIGLKPLVPVTFAHGEKLAEVFPPNSFDLAYASNSLDHAYDPIAVIEQMLTVVKPRRFVYLWHFANIGRVECYAGLHQWNFDIRDGEFIVDDGRRVRSVTANLKGKPQVSADFRAAFDTKVVVAKVQKLTGAGLEPNPRPGGSEAR